jgi:hypothetical protein
VGGEERPRRDRRHVGEGSIGAVGDVDEDAQVLALLHHHPPQGGEARAAPQERERSELRGLGEPVVHEVGERQVAQPASGEHLELLQGALDVVAPLDGVDDG